MAINDLKTGQIAISDISSDGVVNVDVSKYVYEHDAKEYPFSTMLEMKNPSEAALTKEFKFNILGEPNRSITISGGGPTVYTTASTAGLQVGTQVLVDADGSDEAGVNKYQSRVVTAVTNDTSFTINATFGGTLISGDKVYISGFAAGEGSRSPSAIMPSTAQGQNYVQQIKRAIEVTEDMRKERKYFNIENLYRMSNLSQYKYDWELVNLFGIGQKAAVDGESKAIYTTQGFYSALQNPTNATFPFYSSDELQTDSAELTGLLADGSNFTRSVFNAYLQDFMTYGSAEKILLVDSWMMGKISDFGDGYFRTDKNRKVMLNVEVTEILVPGKGVVNIVYNPCFDKGMKFKGAIGFDPINIKKRVYRPTKVQYSIQENDREGKKDQLIGSYSVEWAKLETHGFVTHL